MQHTGFGVQNPAKATNINGRALRYVTPVMLEWPCVAFRYSESALFVKELLAR